MDQDDTKGQDKRNWRERLGIGAQGNAQGSPAAPVANGAQASKDLPKISNDFRKEQAPVSARPVATAKPAPRPPVASPAVRPAPMAPRANAKIISPAPVSPEKLAERLRSQRDASTKLAEQRVQVAKLRGENNTIPAPQPAPQKAPPALPGAPKPKFTFAEESEAKASPPPSRPAIAQPPIQPAQQPQQPQLSPARPPLGGGMNPAVPGFQPRPQPASYQPQQPLGYPPAGQMPQGYPQNYGQAQQPVPPYRPIDPSTGYAPPPGYVPQQRGFGLPPQQGGYVPPPGPRLNVPPRPQGLNTNYQPQQDYGAPQGNFAPTSRMNRPPLRGPAQTEGDGYEEEFYDELPQTRGAARPTSTDYQQAYREAEYGYEDEAPRSKAPWILGGLLLGALLLAGLGVLGYQKYVKPMLSGQTTTQEVPAVAAPEAPAKVKPEEPVAVQPSAAASPTKKQIYDRIVGDQEVLGGDVTEPVETPAAIPEPTKTNQAAPAPVGGSGEDAAPLPIPPPPGGAGEQQGSLDPANEKQSAELVSPAAGESQAAVVAQVPPSPVAAPPAPGEVDIATATTRSLVGEPVANGTEAITDAVDPVPVVKKKIEKVEKKLSQPVKEKVASPKLGSKPVVLVPPAKTPKPAAPKQLDNATVASGSVDAGGGLFDDAAVNAPVPAPVNPAPVKKKRTLADLFSKTQDEPQEPALDVASADQVTPPVSKTVQKKPIASEPVEQVASGGGDFVVQLASFRTRAEASSEYGRLQAKHSATLGRFSPIISEATVGGSTRFRLSVGRMTSEAQASAVCSSLFAGGERDCLVKRR